MGSALAPCCSSAAPSCLAPTNSATTGSWPVVVTWSGVCNGLPATWSSNVICSLMNARLVGTPFCIGDGTGTPCPCGNTGGAGERNSTDDGSRLVASGSASITAGDTVLHGSNAPPLQPGIFFQGTTMINGGNGVVFGDGLRCAGGSIIRIELRT